MDTKQPEALRLAGVLRALDARSRFANAQLTSASEELETLHAENEALRASYDAALDEIASLQARVQELGKAARDVNSRRVQELEAQLAAVAAPKKWAPEEVADGGRGIRWVTNEGVHGRPTDHDVREYLERTPTANGCHCDDCKRFYAAASDVTAAPAQAGEQNNHLPLAITSAPERIWLDLGFNPYEDDVHFSHLHDLTWSQNNATGDGIEYVRADLAAGGVAQAAPVDAERLDYLQECGVTVEVLPGRPGWTFRIGGLHGTVHRSVRTAIDAARAAQKGTND